MKIIKCNGTGNIMAVLTEKENVDEQKQNENEGLKPPGNHPERYSRSTSSI